MKGFVFALVVLVAAGGGAWSTRDSWMPADDAEVETAAPTHVANVQRRDLIVERFFAGSVDFGASYALPIDSSGVVTSAAEPGDIVEFGDEILRIDNQPIFLAEGGLPLFRTLQSRPEQSVRGQRYMIGYDVGQLQIFLVAQGYDDQGALDEIDGVFGPVTERAVREWQRAVGHPDTGRVDRSQLLFAATPLRIDTISTVGARFDTATVTPNQQQVIFTVNDRDRHLAQPGTETTVTDSTTGTTVTGTVIDVRRRTDPSAGEATTTATVELAQTLPDAAIAVEVHVSQVLAEDVLAVPAGDLLALEEGGFAIEYAPTGRAPRLIPVDIGATANGWIEVIGDITITPTNDTESTP